MTQPAPVTNGPVTNGPVTGDSAARPAHVEAELAELRAEYRRRLLGRFDPVSLLWLAAVPEWPLPLAEQCGFPLGDAASLPELVQRLADAGLAERREQMENSGALATLVWLPTSRRPEIGGYLRQNESLDDMVRWVDQLVTALHAAASSDPGRWPQLELWLHVNEFGRDPTGTRLNDAVDGYLRAGDTQHAVAVVAVAQAIGDVLGDPMVSAARRATWRLNRAYRQAIDLRMLADYLPRRELDDVISHLVDGRLRVVHLLGQGGVGKTMLVRSLASGDFADRNSRADFPVARIDFDYLDPRYPETRPVELLLALAAELQGYSYSRGALVALRRFDDVATALHENLAGSGPRAAPRTDPEQLRLVTDAFADFLRELKGPVVLVLDTCEELAKLHAPGAPAPALERTFEILERILERTDHVRVLLAGRRPLVAPADSAGLAGDVTLRRRDYVHVVTMSGFTTTQAVEYIEHRDPEGRVPPGLRDAVLDRCTSNGQVNPFDLAGYLDWAVDEPDLDPSALRSASGDPYVEQRILARITDPAVRGGLPVAVQLGRFDAQMIAPALARRGVDVAAAFSGLAGQEWVTAVSFLTDGRPRVIEIDEHLRARLRTVLDADAGRAVDRQALGADLHRLVVGNAVPDLPVETVEAALRLLPPAQAGRMWVDFEATVAASGEWGWAVQVLTRVAAVEAELAASRPLTVMAAILATQAAAVQRMPGRPGVRRLWDDVAGLAERHPDADQQRRLRFRAACGRLACAASSGSAPLVAEPELQGDLDILLGWPAGVRELPWSVIAALDGLTAGGFGVPDELGNVTDAACAHPDPRVAAAALLARATGHLVEADLPEAVSDVDAALDRLGAIVPSVDPAPAIDWMPPQHLLDRARLARVCCARLAGERPQRSWSKSWRREALDHLDDIDAERLVAASIALDADWALPDRHFATEAAGRERYEPGRRPTHHWHRRTAPLRPSLGRVFGEFGTVDAAIASLHERREAAVDAGDDPDTVTACDAVVIDLCRTYRTTEFSESVHRLAREGPPELRADALAVLALVKGESAASSDRDGWRAWWRIQTSESAGALAAYRYADAIGEPAADLAVLVDGLELERLLRSWGTTAEERRRSGATLDLVRRLTVRGGLLLADRTENGLGAVLRADALVGVPEVAAAVSVLPPRLVGRTALAEGELLALRLPGPACSLLDLARRRLAAAGDEVAADRALILLLLAMARARAIVPDERPDDPVDPLPDGMPGPNSHRFSATRLGAAWQARWRTVEAIRAGAPASVKDPSPEVLLALDAVPPAPARDDPRTRSIPPVMAGLPEAPRSAEPTAAAPTPSAPQARMPGGRGRAVLLGLLVLLVLLAAVVVAVVQTLQPPPVGSVPGSDSTSSRGGVGVAALTVVMGLVLIVALVARNRRRSRRDHESSRPTTAGTTPQMPAVRDELAMYEQRTVAGYVAAPDSGTWTPCRVRVTRDGLLIEPRTPLRLDDVEHGALAAHAVPGEPEPTAASQRPYVVVPVVELGPRTIDTRTRRLAVPALTLHFTRELVLLVDGLRPEPGASVVPVTRIAWRRSHRTAQPAYLGPLHLLPTEHIIPWERGVAYSVVHLVGEPVPTARAGWRMRVTGAVSEKAQYTSTRSTYAGEELLGPDDLRKSEPSLVVLQANPVDGPPQPLGKLRDGMLGLALGLHDAGIDWVVVVPPLPDALGAEAVRLVATIFDAADATTAHPGLVLDLAHDLRATIAGHPFHPSEYDSAVDDVLLLCRATNPVPDRSREA